MGVLRLSNNFSLRIKIGDSDLPLSLTALRECTIVQDMYSFLPSFRLRLVDSEGTLTHLVPLDRDSNRLSMLIRNEGTKDDFNSFEFMIFRKRPVSEFNEASIFDISGLLYLDKSLIYEIQGYSGNIADSIQTIADDIEVDDTDISNTLNYEKNLVNPGWNRLQFLQYLKRTLEGSEGEGGYQCFIKMYKEKSILVFKTLQELVKLKTVKNFIVGEAPFEDYIPVNDYEIYDNYKVLTLFGGKVQDYKYFDYFNNVFVEDSASIDDYYSLTEYFLMDNDDEEYGNFIRNIGRNNDYTLTYEGRAKNRYFEGLTNLSKIWVFTWGVPNVVPGDTVKLIFGKGVVQGNMLSHQYSGYWLVERIVHNVGNIFVSKLLLTRNGMDTSLNTTLYKASKKKVE